MSYKQKSPLPVANGGTGDTSLTAYSVVCGGTTSTSALQNVSGVGTSGQVLTSNGASALPTWQAAGGGGFSTINVQTFTTTGSGTYTPTSGMSYCIVECVGGGGAGGGVSVSGTGNGKGANGGGGGGYCRKVYSAATIGASQSLSVGAAASNTTFGSGGTLITASAGTSAAQSTNSGIGARGVGGSASGGDLNIKGQDGLDAISIGSITGVSAMGGAGGSTVYGFGGYGNGGTGGSGGAASGYGAGGGGGSVETSGTATGGSGASGIIIITEFI